MMMGRFFCKVRCAQVVKTQVNASLETFIISKLRIYMSKYLSKHAFPLINHVGTHVMVAVVTLQAFLSKNNASNRILSIVRSAVLSYQTKDAFMMLNASH